MNLNMPILRGKGRTLGIKVFERASLFENSLTQHLANRDPPVYQVKGNSLPCLNTKTSKGNSSSASKNVLYFLYKLVCKTLDSISVHNMQKMIIGAYTKIKSCLPKCN